MCEYGGRTGEERVRIVRFRPLSGDEGGGERSQYATREQFNSGKKEAVSVAVKEQ